jgi:hypothetical protein
MENVREKQGKLGNGGTGDGGGKKRLNWGSQLFFFFFGSWVVVRDADFCKVIVTVT